MTPATTTQNGRFVKGAWIPDIPEPSSLDAAPIHNAPATIDEASAVEIVCTLKHQCEQMNNLTDAFSTQMHLNEAIYTMAEDIEYELVAIKKRMLTKDTAATILLVFGIMMLVAGMILIFA